MRRRRTHRSRGALTPAIVIWRIGHGVVAAGFLASIAHVWWCALTRRRGPLLRPAIAVLSGEGLLVAINHGECPLGPLGDRLGDPVPLFELMLSPRAARRAVPLLGGFTALGIALLAAPPPGWTEEPLEASPPREDRKGSALGAMTQSAHARGSSSVAHRW